MLKRTRYSVLNVCTSNLQLKSTSITQNDTFTKKFRKHVCEIRKQKVKNALKQKIVSYKDKAENVYYIHETLIFY